MSFVVGSVYSRLEIASGFGIPEDPHAVLIAGGEVLAVVINKSGAHPSGKKYKNELKPPTLVMHGENDWRGARLENSSVEVPLFFSHGSDGRYRYEGKMKWTKTTQWDGEPFREFKLG